MIKMNGLVLNLGLKGIRVIIFDGKGNILSSAYKRINTYLNKNFVEQDPHEWWDKGLACIKEALKTVKNIDFITVTASSACLISVDEKGECLIRSIMVSDKRAIKEAEEIGKLSSFHGLPYRSDTMFMIPKILWVKRNMPEIYDKTYKFLSPNDFFIHKMTNQFVIDELNATKYFTKNNSYPKNLLKELNIDVNLLPEIKNTGFLINLSEDFMEELNLEKKIPVVITTYDAICSLFGVSTNKEGEACDMSGTVISLRTLTDKNIIPNETRIFSQRLFNKNIVGGSNNLGGGLIEWLLQIFYLEGSYDELEALKNRFSAVTGLIFLPYLMGERAPIWDSEVRGAFLGIERFHTKDDLARAVLESVAYLLKSILEVIEENGIKVSTIYVSGGLSKINLVNQIKADVTGKNIYKVKEIESTALGAYLLARHTLDKDFNPKDFIEVEKIYTPDTSKKEVYSRSYKLFKIAYEGLKDFH